MLSPLRVWAMTLRRLPDTAWPVGLGASGMLAILAAVVWVGGLSYWFRFYPTAEEASGAFVAARRSDAQGEQELDRVSRVLGFYKSQADAPAAWASDGSASTSAPRASGSATSRPAASAVLDSRPTERCVIVGIVPASGGQPPGLVLARLRDGQLAFAGVVRSGLNKMPGVLDRLSKLGRTRPLVEGLNLDAVWVRPEVFCEVHQSGSNSKGEFVDPTLKGLIED